MPQAFEHDPVGGVGFDVGVEATTGAGAGNPFGVENVGYIWYGIHYSGELQCGDSFGALGLELMLTAVLGATGGGMAELGIVALPEAGAALIRKQWLHV